MHSITNTLFSLKQKVSLAEKTVDPVFEDHRGKLKHLLEDVHQLHLGLFKQFQSCKELYEAMKLMNDSSAHIYATLGVPLAQVENLPQFCTIYQTALSAILARLDIINKEIGEYEKLLNLTKKRVEERDTIVLDCDRFRDNLKKARERHDTVKISEFEARVGSTQVHADTLNKMVTNEIAGLYASRRDKIEPALIATVGAWKDFINRMTPILALAAPTPSVPARPRSMIMNNSCATPFDDCQEEPPPLPPHYDENAPPLPYHESEAPPPIPSHHNQSFPPHIPPRQQLLSETDEAPPLPPPHSTVSTNPFGEEEEPEQDAPPPPPKTTVTTSHRAPPPPPTNATNSGPPRRSLPTPRAQPQTVESMAGRAVGGAIANTVTDPRVQERTGSAVASWSTDEATQAKFGTAVANNTDNSLVKALASNSLMQKAAGKAVASVATNKSFQQKVANTVAEQAQNEETQQRVISSMKTGASSAAHATHSAASSYFQSQGF
ncbi:hypothetical protein Pelo_10483 [Pelomyxa schiedti]|nr:hypothetical protein Pelo_10483 [Pelomyxa schiedti]